jgi:riboflavin synthase
MFTGIVQCSAIVFSKVDKTNGCRLIIQVPEPVYLDSVEIGASIAINGVCLTVVAFNDCHVSFDLIQETLSRSDLGALVEGDRVNFERAARWGDEIGGHLLSGHIQVKGTVAAIKNTDAVYEMKIDLPEAWHRYIFEKGYVAVDGISLTIGKVDKHGFYLHLIPETLRVTTLGSKTIGSRVNLEIDSQTQAVVDTVERIMAANAFKPL